MKNLSLILITALSIAVFSAKAQTKKPVKKATTTKTTPTKKTTTTTKITPTKTATNTNMVTSKPIETDEKTGVKPNSQSSSQSVKLTKTNTDITTYKAAIGLKFIYGISVTGKVFIKENSALEGILRYNGTGGLGSNIAFTGLYEYHTQIKDVNGLRWYVGGGGHVNYFSWKDSNLDGVTTFGIAGVVGLEYKFANLPLAISADWQPAYIISNSVGFSAENGGVGIKYTF